jgi:hypothetical protein
MGGIILSKLKKPWKKRIRKTMQKMDAETAVQQEAGNPLRVSSTTGLGDPWAQYIRTWPVGAPSVLGSVAFLLFFLLHLV